MNQPLDHEKECRHRQEILQSSVVSLPVRRVQPAPELPAVPQACNNNVTSRRAGMERDMMNAVNGWEHPR